MNKTTLFVSAVLAGLCLVSFSPHSPAAQNSYVWRNVKIGGGGGFVDGIVFSTKQKDLIYCRTDIGAAYRWDAKSRSWIPLNDWVGQANGNLRGAESIALDPTDSNRVYIAAGTYSNQKAAIIRSDDQGRSWKVADVPFTMGGNEDGRCMGERLAVDPNMPSVLYFGSRHDGLWKSTDYGATWAKVDSFPAVPETLPQAQQPPAANSAGGGFAGFRRGPRGAGVGWIVFDPRDGRPGKPTQTIFAGTAAPGDDAKNLYRSTDAGATWHLVEGQPAGLIPQHGVLAPDGTLYLSYGNSIGPNGITNGSVWKVDTSVSAWTDITPDKPTTDSPGGFGGLAIDAEHPDTVMVATLDHWHPNDEIYRSTDAGAHWTAISPKATQDPSLAPWLKWGKPTPRFGWWIAALAIDPFHPGRAMYGTGATIWGTDNITDSDSGKPTQWKVYADWLEETAILDLISPPDGPHLISAVGDIGGFRHDDLSKSPAAGMSANPIFTTTNSLDYAANKPSLVARVGSGGQSGGGESGVSTGAYSTDGGATWTPFAAQPENGRGSGSVAITADGSTMVWCPNGGAPSYSKDNGATWTACTGLPQPPPATGNNPFARFRGPRFNVFSDRVNPAKLYTFDSSTGTVYVSTDSGASFSAKATGLPSARGSLRPAYGREGDLWLTFGNQGLYHSTDSGAIFTQIPSALVADGIGFGKAAPGHDYPALYLIGNPSGRVHGVYRSDDQGATWIRINDDQHQYGWIGMPVTGDPRVYGRVYVGTNGRGIVYGDIAK